MVDAGGEHMPHGSALRVSLIDESDTTPSTPVLYDRHLYISILTKSIATWLNMFISAY